MTDQERETYYPANQEEWRKWLAQHHETKESIWLVLYRKDSGVPTLTWSEAVDIALCYGWIDSTRRSRDEQSFIQYFGKRKDQSTWSKVNKEKVDRLIEKGEMQAAGLKRIAIAKKNGSWSVLDTVEALITPEDLAKALAKYEVATDYFHSLKRSIRKRLLYWIVSAKRPDTRAKRIDEITQHAAEKEIPKAFR